MNHIIVRVLHNFPVWLPQTQTWMFTQIKYLPEDVEAHVVCERTKNLDQFSLPNINSLKDESKTKYYLEKGLRKLKIRLVKSFLSTVANKTNANVVHTHFGDNGWIYLKSVKSVGVKHIVTFYGYDVNRLPFQDKRWLHRYQELFDQADAFLFEGPYMAKQLIRIGCPEEKVKIHHLGVEVDAIPYKPRYRQADEPLRVLIASAFREKKGIPYALEALAKFQHIAPIEITIIGDANSERRNIKEREKIFNILNSSGLRSKTRLLGYQPYSVLFKEAYNHHIFLSPSVNASDGDTEGGAPVSIIEMMATGMPVVSTSHCDIPEVVKYDIDNWLVKERDVEGLVSKLEWLIKNSDDWKNFLDAGRKHVEKEFSAIEQGKRLGSIYKSILDT